MNTITTTAPAMYAHQQYTAEFIRDHKRVFITSDTGTGKTRSVLEGYTMLRRRNADVGRMLVIAPLSILHPAWIGDIETWTPWLSCGVSTSGSDRKRLGAILAGADVVVTNHDAVKWLLKNPEHLRGFNMIVVDESSAFKHRTSDRSSAINALVKKFDYRIMMTGTPYSNSIAEIWHQVYLLDDGERLGRMYHGFVSQVCTPMQVGPDPRHMKWVDKLGAADMVAERLRDISVRFAFEDCIDIPENTTHYMKVDMPPKLMAQYEQLRKEAVLELQEGRVNAVHAGAKAQKLLQLCSGAVYDEDHVKQVLNNDRYELVLELVKARKHSIVAFNWRHQREELCRLAKRDGISFAVIDGSVPMEERTRIVRGFQGGTYQVIFAHPQSAGHGLTLTRGTATIWASPTYNAEWFQQFNARIYRAGQTQKTETILIAAKNTKEIEVYEVLQGKRERMFSLLDIFANTTG